MINLKIPPIHHIQGKNFFKKNVSKIILEIQLQESY